MAGASVRWAVGIDQEKAPQLEFQGLPAAAANIQKKFFSSDNSVSVLHGAFPLNADLFDGVFATGLVPIFFSTTPTHARNYLQQHPDAVKEAVLSANSRFLHMEHLSLPEAIVHLNAKKGRMAKGTPAFPMPTTSRKRGRPQNQGISGSGTDPYTRLYILILGTGYNNHPCIIPRLYTYKFHLYANRQVTISS